MRVHHITNDYSMFSGGAQRVVRALYAALREQNVETYVLGLIEQKDFRLAGAQSLGLKTPYQWQALAGIHQYVTKWVKPDDIVHGHCFPTIFYLSLLSMLGRLKCRLVCTEHSTSNRRRGTRLGRILDSVTYARYEQVIAISEGVELELLKWKPGLRGKTKVIPNGVSLHFEHTIHRTANAPKKCLKIISVGNLRPAKNYDTALKAVALLGDLDFEYHIAGQGEWQEKLLKLRQELGLEQKVRFLGYVEDIPGLLASADIFLMPSRWEGFGLAAVEGMNASLPLVTSNVTGLREIVNGGPPCALPVDPASPESIATELRQLLSSAPLRLQLGANAFKQAQKFSLNRMVESHINLYAQFV